MVSKMTWGIGWTFIRAPESLKNCTLMGSFFPKHIMFSKIKGKLTCSLKNDITFALWPDPFVQSLQRFRWESTEELSHDTKEWCKVWRKTDSWFQKGHEEFGEF